MSSESMMNFVSSVYVSELLNRQMVNAAQELAQRAVAACGRHYDFDVDEALRMLGLVNAKVSHSKRIEVVTKKSNVNCVKSSFPLPFNGEMNYESCYALRQNNGLYTQCKTSRNGMNSYCKQCKVLADKNDGVPEYGTIQQRTEVGIFEYVDPKGRKPVPYSKVMKKFNVDKEKVLEEAAKQNMIIDLNHFNIEETVSKRGRPATIKAPKEVKGTKGRPKKVKKVLEINGDDDDLFATLVADANKANVVANDEANDEANVDANDDANDEAEKAAFAKQKLDAEKAEKVALAKQKLDAEKAEKVALSKQKLDAEKAEKAALAQQKKEATEKAKLEKEALAKEKKEATEKAKLEKEALTKQKKEATEKAKLEKEALTKQKKDQPVAAAADTDGADVVKKIEIDGKKYLKSKTTGIIYDYKEYVDNGEQVVIGKWNETSNKIDFAKSNDDDDDEEEEEEDYDM
jgi:hypothetical protein